MRRHGLRPAAGAHHQIQFGVDSFHRGLFAAVGRTPHPAASRIGLRGHSPLVVRLSGDRDFGLPVDRRDVRPQAVQIHQPSEPSAVAAQQAYPHGRAPHRGEGPVAFLEGAPRRPRAAAFVGPDVAHGSFARGARRRPARNHRQYDLRDRRGDPLAARNLEQPFAARAQRFRTGARHAELHRQERGCTT